MEQSVHLTHVIQNLDNVAVRSLLVEDAVTNVLMEHLIYLEHHYLVVSLVVVILVARLILSVIN